MNALVLLMALLAVSFGAGLISDGRAVRGIGLVSGIEWVAVGVLLGPAVLGVIDTQVQAQVGPIALVAAGWLAFVLGLDFGVVRRRRLKTSRMLIGFFIGALTFGAVAVACFVAIPTWAPELISERLIVALGLGAVATETTSPAMRWVAERHGARGPLYELLCDVAEAKDAIPILGAGVVLCLRPGFTYPWPHPELSLNGITIGFGALLGVVALVLLGREPRRDQAWGVLLGTAVLGMGVAARLLLPALTVMFAMGWVLGALSRHRDQLTAMVDSSRRPALLPALILVGARLDPQLAWHSAALIGVMLSARVVASWVSGALLSLGDATQRRATATIGFGLLPAGELTFSVGLALALRFPDARGGVFLAGAAAAAILGELVGTVALKRSLRRAGAMPEPLPPASAQTATAAAETPATTTSPAAPTSSGEVA
jgi:hypothetical protein